MDTTTTFQDRLSRLFQAWIAILIGLYLATGLVTAGWVLGADLLSGTGEGLARIPVDLGYVLSFGMLFAIPVAFVFSVLALPFLMFRRFIVGPDLPYIQPGYGAVAIYGPAITVVMMGGWSPGAWLFIIPYEAVALVATAIYIRVAEPLGLFAQEA